MKYILYFGIFLACCFGCKKNDSLPGGNNFGDSIGRPVPAAIKIETYIERPIQTQVITIAGATTNLSKDGIGKNAGFSGPVGICRDKTGNLFVAERSGAIRKISPSLEVTTIAGMAGYNSKSLDDTGRNARFTDPISVCVDKNDNVYVLEFRRNGPVDSFFIRRIEPGGKVTTLTKNNGYITNPISGSAAYAGLSGGIACDEEGNLFVTQLNFLVKISPAGVETRVSMGAGVGGSGELDISKNLSIYFAGSNNRVFKTDLNGNSRSYLQHTEKAHRDGRLDSAYIDSPTAVLEDNLGRVIISERYGFRAIIISNGVERMVTLAGGGTENYNDVKGEDASISYSWDICLDPIDNGIFFIQDSFIRKLVYK